METPKNYWAAPLFTQAEQSFNQNLATELEQHDYTVFLPQKECAEVTGKVIYETCLSGLRSSNLVIAILDGADADSGTCWECGYAV